MQRYEIYSPDGKLHEIAFEQLALFLNNATLLYGIKQLKAGMTRDEARQALENACFEPVVAEAFLKKMTQQNHIAFVNGQLRISGESA